MEEVGAGTKVEEEEEIGDGMRGGMQGREGWH